MPRVTSARVTGWKLAYGTLMIDPLSDQEGEIFGVLAETPQLYKDGADCVLTNAIPFNAGFASSVLREIQSDISEMAVHLCMTHREVHSARKNPVLSHRHLEAPASRRRYRARAC